MFRKGFVIGEKEIEFSFRDFISEDDTIYMITGHAEPVFMGYSKEEDEWVFLTSVPDSLFEVEEEFSDAIMEEEAVEDSTGGVL
ncbi:MAG: hypothetical protein EOP49_13280 [Sphingobacteriales bacterium]|nr:MAG: hypothetical protein EOP49_13280 [Sphingobacteriales bacterium]